MMHELSRLTVMAVSVSNTPKGRTGRNQPLHIVSDSNAHIAATIGWVSEPVVSRFVSAEQFKVPPPY